MNRWKIAFWILLVAAILIIGFLAYGNLDQGVSLTYMKEGYSNTETDLQRLIDILNSKSRSKDTIIHLIDIQDINSDTLEINRCRLFFKSGQLDSIKQVW